MQKACCPKSIFSALQPNWIAGTHRQTHIHSYMCTYIRRRWLNRTTYPSETLQHLFAPLLLWFVGEEKKLSKKKRCWIIYFRQVSFRWQIELGLSCCTKHSRDKKNSNGSVKLFCYFFLLLPRSFFSGLRRPRFSCRLLIFALFLVASFSSLVARVS